jgi:hypothetical protein
VKFWQINAAIKEEMQLDPGLVTDAERVRFINDCLDEIGGLQLIELEYTDTNVSSQYPTIPQGLTKIIALYWNGNKLTPMDSDIDFNSVGQPVGYVVQSGKVRLYPKPSAPGELKWVYTGTPPHCTETDIIDETSTAEPSLPENWHRLLITYACYRSHRKNGNIIMAREYKNDYDRDLASNIRTYVGFLNSQITKARSPEIYTGGDW